MNETPNLRNLIGVLGLIFGLGVYGLLIAELSTHLGNMPFVVEVIFYIIAGLIWLWPARALLRWMLAGNLER